MLNTLSQFITSNKRDGTRYMPFAFIELGVAMLSSILNSEVVIEINKRLGTDIHIYTRNPSILGGISFT